MLFLTLVVVSPAQSQQTEAQNDELDEPSAAPNGATPDYPVPLRFSVIGNGVDLKPMRLEYDLASSNGRSLQMGNVRFDEKTFSIAMRSMERLEPRMGKLLSPEEKREWVFTVTWPENLPPTGTGELISRTGRVLWSFEIDRRGKDRWQEQLETWRGILRRNQISDEQIERNPLYSTGYGVRNLRNEAAVLWQVDEPFRFCLTLSENRGQTRICTPQYEIRRENEQMRLEFVPRTLAPARVILYNEAGPLSQSLEIRNNRPIQFFAELSTGASLEFYGVPKRINVVEMVEVTGTRKIILVGEGKLPLQKARIVKEEQVSQFEEFIGWQQTIGDFRTFWETEISRDKPFVMIPGEGGGIFKQEFVIKKLPREEIRVFAHKRIINGTYVNGAKVFAKKPAELTVSSETNSAAVDEDDPTELTWRFGAPKRGVMNRSYILLDDNGQSHKAYWEMYKGYPRELSTRLTGVLGSQSNYVLMGEVAFSYWFEDIFSWTQYYLARQRWGLSAKAFRSLTPVKVSTTESNLESYTAELKYRLNPGLWTRDETWGLMVGLQNVSYDIFKADMLGAGIFWARSMPKIFDDFFNLASFMRYPKWVDMEFIYYLQSLTSDAPLRNPFDTSGAAGNWALNFHGKVLWRKNIFGEAGFGIKQYDFNKTYTTGNVRKINFQFTSFYGTVGIGMSF